MWRFWLKWVVTRIHTNKRSEGVEISHFWDFLAKIAILAISGDRKCLDIENYYGNMGFLVKMSGHPYSSE